MSQRIVHLTPPALSPEHIKEKIVCIRAHRERIFQISTEKIGNKLICHNYGHGGGGWTFLFGCVQESIKQFEQALLENPVFAQEPITVIGAGCYGLLTAILLKQRGHSVKILTKELYDIPSYKAAGFFFPRARECSTPQERAIFERLGKESYMTYLQIVHGTHPFMRKGAKILPCYFALDNGPEFDSYISQGLMRPPEKVTINFGNLKHHNVMEQMTLFIHATDMMDELHRVCQELHILITLQVVTSFESLQDTIIFNCAGLGAKLLTKDHLIIPVQGHLITLKDQPALSYMINVKVVMVDAQGRARDELIYFAPKDEGILGVTFKRGTDSMTSNYYEFDRLLERCHDFFGT